MSANTILPPGAGGQCVDGVEAVAVRRCEVTPERLSAIYRHAEGCSDCRAMLALIEMLTANRVVALDALHGGAS